MLSPNDREDLRWAMQAALLEQTAVLHENKETVKDYVLQEATYEQLLNLCFNPFSSDSVYMESIDLEHVAKDLIFEMTGVYENLGVVAGQDFDLDTTAGKFGLLESLVTELSSSEINKLNSPDGQFKRRMRANAANTVKAFDKKKAAEKTKKAAEAAKKAAAEKAAKSGKTLVGKLKGAAKQAPDKKTAARAMAGVGKTWAKNNKGKTAAGAAGAAALAAGAYYVYRKARKAGKDKRQAAQAAASAAKTPEEKAKWSAKARG
jgi:hypothetical protein